MNINVNIPLQVSITCEQQLQITVEYLCKHFDWDTDYWISSDGKVKYSRIMHSTHAFCEEVIIRDATSTDYDICNILKLLS